VAIETRLLNQRVDTSRATVWETLANHNLATMVLPTDGGKVLRIRKGTTPEPDQLELSAPLAHSHRDHATNQDVVVTILTGR
jgi:hypothetical protein